MFSTDLAVDIRTMHSLGLERFSAVRKNVWTCRCPVCGDSKKRKYLTRFYFYVKQGQLNTCCHNCGYSRSFFNFVKEHVPFIYESYKKETMLSKVSRKRPVDTQPCDVVEVKPEPEVAPDIMSFIGKIKICGDLPINHPARLYLQSRRFSVAQMNNLWYADDFSVVARTIDHALSESALARMKHPRIVIPFLSETAEVVEMVQGRSLDSADKLRYLSIKSSESVEKVFGKHAIDYSQQTRVVEGPFDSIFVDNCVATCDANLTRVDSDVYIWDNQPRNKEVVEYIENAIDQNRSVVIWPTSPAKKEDINDMIIHGMSVSALNELIKARTFKGIKAKAELMKWKRV